MRRILLCASLFAVAALGTGCRSDYVAGRCDCHYNPANSVIAPASNPYPVIGAPVTTGPANSMPEKMPDIKGK